MRLKAIVLLLIIFFTSNLAYTQFEAEHQWKEFGYFGGHAGTYSINDDTDGYFGGVMGFYHNQLVHRHPSVWVRDISDLGIIGSGSYYGKPESDLSATLQFSKGFWLDRTALLQFSSGLAWSETYDWGVASMALLSYMWSFSDDTINAGAVFIQSEGYFNNDISKLQWRFSLGISLGIGGLNEVNQ